MKKLLSRFATLMLAVVFVFSISSCKREKCTREITLADGSHSMEEYYCDGGTTGGGTYCSTCGTGGGTGGGGTIPTDGTDYRYPLTDPNVFHEGTYPVIMIDPLWVGKTHPNTSSRLILSDRDQNGYVDLESMGPANHFIKFVGAVLINGFYYRAEITADQNDFLGNGSYANVTYGDIIPNAVTFSNKAYGYSGDPMNCPKVNGDYFISPAAQQYFFKL